MFTFMLINIKIKAWLGILFSDLFVYAGAIDQVTCLLTAIALSLSIFKDDKDLNPRIFLSHV